MTIIVSDSDLALVLPESGRLPGETGSNFRAR